MTFKQSIFKNPIFIFFVFIVVAFILYGNTLPHKYNLDDAFVTNGNPQVKKGISGLYEIFTLPYSDRENYVYGYRPIAKASFAIEYSLWKFNPHLSHLVNIILYAISLFLLFILFQKIFKTIKPIYLWLMVLLFASHPIHTEVVSSLKNREELFCFLFGFLSLYFFLLFFKNYKWYHILLGIVSLLLSLLSKQTGVVFIAIIPLTLLLVSDIKFTYFQKLWNVQSKWIIISIIIWWATVILMFFKINAEIKLSNRWIYSLLFLSSFMIMMFHFVKNQSITKLKLLYSNYSIWILLILIIIFLKFYTELHFFISIFYVFLFIPFLNTNIKDELKNSVQHLSKRTIKIIGIILLILILSTITFVFTELVTFKIAGTQDSKLYYWQNPLYFGSTQISLLANGFNTFTEYCKLLFFPYPLRFYYGYATIDNVTIYNPKVWFGFILLLISFLASIKSFVQKQYYGYGLLIFILGLIPFLNFKWIVPGIIAERLVYLSSIGFAIAIVDLFYHFSESKWSFIKPKQMQYLLILLIVVFSFMTIQRNKAWSTPQTLFETDLPHLSNSVKANDLYAAWLLRSAEELMAKRAPVQQIKSKLELSLFHYKRTVQIYPKHLEGWNNIGIMYSKYFNNPDEALFYFNKAISYDSTYINPYINIGAIEIIRKNYQKALNTYFEILKYDTKNASAYNGIVQSYYGLKDTIEANNWNVKVLNELKAPDMYYANKGSYYLQNNDTLNAITCFETAFEFNKNDLTLCVFLGKYFASKQNNVKANYYHDMASRIKKSNNK